MSIYEREIKRIAEGDLPWEKLEGKSILISRGNRDDREMPGGCADGEKCECHA